MFSSLLFFKQKSKIMRYTHILPFLLALCSGFFQPLSAQNNTCGPEPVVDTSCFSGTAFSTMAALQGATA